MNKLRITGYLFLLISVYGFGHSDVYVIKNGTMNDYKTTTIGKAFDSSFDNPKWESFEGNKGEIVVQFTGTISEELHNGVIAEPRGIVNQIEEMKRTGSLQQLDDNPLFGQQIFVLFQLAVEKFGGPDSKFFQGLNNKYNCELNNRVSTIYGMHGSFPFSKTKSDDDVQNYLIAALNNLLNESWKPGEPVTVQWIVHPNKETFELYHMGSKTWEGMDYEDILEAIYNWQPKSNERVNITLSDIDKSKQDSIEVDSQTNVEYKTKKEKYISEEDSLESDSTDLNINDQNIKNSFSERCMSNDEANQVLSDLKEKWWTQDEQNKLDISNSQSLLIRKKAGDECVVLIESKEKNYTCHACPVNLGIALFIKSEEHWQKTYEQKNVATLGQFGKLPEASITQIGDDNFGLNFNSSTMAQGHYTERNILFAMVEGKVKKVIQVNTHYDNHGYAQSADMEPSEWNAEIQFIPNENKEFYDIKLVSTETESKSDSSNKNKPNTKTEIYKFDGSEYILSEEKTNQQDLTNVENLQTEELIKFAEGYIDAVNTTNIDELIIYYNDFVQFHGKNYSLHEIRQDKENYFKRWPVVTFNINGEIEIVDKGNVAEIKIPVRYLVENEYRNEAVSGTAVEHLIVSSIDGKWKIIAESEEKIDQKTYSTKKSTSKNQVEKKPEKKSNSTENTPNDKITKTEDTNAQFNRAVNTYVDYLNGLNQNDRLASCTQYSSTSKLNDFEKAAFKRACEITGSNIAKPTPTQNPESYPRQQEEQQVDVNKVIDIIGDVIRRTY